MKHFVLGLIGFSWGYISYDIAQKLGWSLWASVLLTATGVIPIVILAVLWSPK